MNRSKFMNCLFIATICVCIFLGCSDDSEEDTEPTSAPLFGLWGDPEGVYVVGDGPGLGFVNPSCQYLSNGKWKSIPFDLTIFRNDWQEYSPETSTSLLMYTVSGSNEAGIFAAGDWGMVYVLEQGIWQTAWRGLQNIDIWGDATMRWWDAHAVKDHVFFVGGNGLVLMHYADQWELFDTELDGLLFRVWGSSPDNVYATGSGGTVHFDGSKWTKLNFGTNESFIGVSGTASENIYLSGSEGTIMHFDGNNWTVDSESNNGWKRLVHCLPDGSVIALSNNERIFRVEFREEEWITSLDLDNVVLWDIWGRHISDIYVVGYAVDNSNTVRDGIVYHYDGSTWSEVFRNSEKVNVSKGIVAP